MKKEIFKCDVCGKTAKLETGKRHWCDCNPACPFYMTSVKMRNLTNLLCGGFMRVRDAEIVVNRLTLDANCQDCGFRMTGGANVGLCPKCGSSRWFKTCLTQEVSR